MATLPPNKTLCFLETITAKKEYIINDEEYYHHLLHHLTGINHGDESCTKDDRTLLQHDAFAHSVQTVSREIGHVEDAAPIERLFKAYRTGTTEDVIAIDDSMNEKEAECTRRLLATRALIDKRADVLDFCVTRGGFAYDDTFKGLANSLRHCEHPKTYGVLQRSEFRKEHPHKSLAEIAATFDIGGTHPVDW
ncbi:hypothetical protein Hte_008243 [Hypoxylon texense]